MARKRGGEPEKDNSERWLLTYSDLITLLMIFFVVMYSMSKVDADKFQAMAESLNITLGGASAAQVEIGTSPSGPNLIETFPAKTPEPSGETLDEGKGAGLGNADIENMTIESIKQKLDKFAFDNQIETKLVSSIEERGLVISIQDTLLFESGSAVITPRAREILEKINNVLASAPNYIKVEGHTDNLSISTDRFPSNWELSVLRATNVLHIMQETIHAEQLSATGYGEFRPVTNNDSEANRARNRRVDLVILRSKYDLTEPGQSLEADPTSGTIPTPFNNP
ncbi:flagellar motor protein [Desulfitobacterium dichloroeliminans LMG P-21439]|uniref:Flagellar motor protein n=1 Tax=Desulfitobacterium dichloroeliminans (strain LMG P-21439 / DCA1) TaxID=871963 RepID=L0FBB9_DESDL|nr:flagellar motor protein MotB [Desulfitobacterium dichloroeliminans]AGA70325.1 flagellar motor protein [Desulfitobacterium dichloroeliminans LMG P-21439]